MKKIEILGVGCYRCRKAEHIVRKAVEAMGLIENKDFTIEKILDPNQIALKGILATPGVAVDGKIVSSGKIPKESEITGWFK